MTKMGNRKADFKYKTIKDLIEVDIPDCLPEHLDYGGSGVSLKEYQKSNTQEFINPIKLKEFGIEWIKRISEDDFEIIGDVFGFQEEKRRTSTFEERALLISFIKEIFNISDEDIRKKVAKDEKK